jgi:hypothetical protein
VGSRILLRTDWPGQVLVSETAAQPEMARLHHGKIAEKLAGGGVGPGAHKQILTEQRRLRRCEPDATVQLGNRQTKPDGRKRDDLT